MFTKLWLCLLDNAASTMNRVTETVTGFLFSWLLLWKKKHMISIPLPLPRWIIHKSLQNYYFFKVILWLVFVYLFLKVTCSGGFLTQQWPSGKLVFAPTFFFLFDFPLVNICQYCQHLCQLHPSPLHSFCTSNFV